MKKLKKVIYLCLVFNLLALNSISLYSNSTIDTNCIFPITKH